MKATALLAGLTLLLAVGCGSSSDEAVNPEAKKTPDASGNFGNGQFSASADPAGGTAGTQAPSVGMGSPSGGDKTR